MYKPFRALWNCAKSAYSGASIPPRERRTGRYEAAVLALGLGGAGLAVCDSPQVVQVEEAPRREGSLNKIEIVPIPDENAPREERVPKGEPETTADILFDDFPIEIPHAKSVVKYGRRGSAYCLVHIRQLHYMSNENADQIGGFGGEWVKEAVGDARAKMHLKADDILKNVSKILENQYLRGMRSVYLEGIFPEDEEDFNKLREIFRNGYVDGGEDFAENFDPSDPEKPWLTRPLFVTLLRGSGNGLLEIKPAEDREQGDRTKEDMMKYVQWQIQRIEAGEKWDGALAVPASAFDPREDALLEIISQKKDFLALTVYGGKHDWRNNVDRWREPVSLIEVTPEDF